MKQKILMHVTFFGQICDKPGIKLFLSDAPEPVVELFGDILDCEHAIDETGTHYFMHSMEFERSGEMDGIVVSSLSKERLDSLKNAMQCVFDDKEMSITIPADFLASDTAAEPEVCRFEIEPGYIGISVGDYVDGHYESISSMYSIPTIDEGLLIPINDERYSFYFHEACIHRANENGDYMDILEVDLNGKAKAFYEKMILDQGIDEDQDSTLSL